MFYTDPLNDLQQQIEDYLKNKPAYRSHNFIFRNQEAHLDCLQTFKLQNFESLDKCYCKPDLVGTRNISRQP